MAGRTRLPFRRRITLSAAAVLALAIGGCSGMGGTTDPPGASRTVLPYEVGVRAAIAASEAALVRRGYTIERDEATSDKGAVVGVGRQLRWLGPEPRVRIEASLTAGGVEVQISRTPPRNAEADRDLIAEVRGRLGLQD